MAAPSATALTASPDGATLAEGGKDGKVRLRDAKTLETKQTLRVHDGPVTDVAWHPTLPFLATAAEDLRVRIWNVETGKLIAGIWVLSRPPIPPHLESGRSESGYNTHLFALLHKTRVVSGAREMMLPFEWR